MKKVVVFFIAALIAFAPLAFAGSDSGKIKSPGPAPNSGDGIPDGSGFDHGASLLEIMGIPFSGPGPAPNSGDGIPDGSGWDVPPKGTK